MRYRPFQVCLSLTLGLWTGLALPLAVWAETDWYTLKSHGQVIGKVGIHSYPAQGDQAGTVTEVSHVNHFTRQGSPFEVNSLSRFVESPQGNKALSFSYSYDLGDQHLLEAHGHLTNNAIDMRLLREDMETTGQAPVTGGQFLFPGGEGIKQVYRQHYQDKPGAQFSYQTLHLGVQPQVVNTEVTTLNREKLALATGESKPVRKFALSNPADRDKKIYEWRDSRGKLYKSQSVGMGGMEMVYASQREVREIDRNTVDLVNASAVLSAIIPQPRITNEAIYKISPLASSTLDLKALFPESFTQRIVPSTSPGLAEASFNTLYLNVSQKEPADSLAPFPVRFDNQYLKATPYLEVDDPQLDQTALVVVGKENRAYYAARKLQQWVYQNIAYKDLTLGFASAKETFQRRQGDCTEHAVLLASMLRSLGIPSRVAIGLIYLPDQDSELGKFVFHMWTEAYIGDFEKGDWVPLDATNPEPLPDATHIKLADSSLSEPGDLIRLTERVTDIMGKIRLDVVKAVSPSQSVYSIEKGAGGTAIEIPKIDINRIDVRVLSRQAIKHFRVDLPPASLSADSADGLFTSGMEAQSKGQSEQARNYFAKSLAKARHPIALYQMGERLLAVGQYDLAKQAFTEAKHQDETLAPLVANWMSAGLPETSLSGELATLYGQAVARHYQARDNGQSACELFTALTRQGVGNFFPAYRGLGESCAGPEAVQAFKTALAINPNDFQSAESLGDAYMENQRYWEAAQAYQEALQSLSGKIFTQSKPWITNLRGKLEIASGAARLIRNQKDAQGWFHIGKGLALQHRSEEAGQAFQNALIIQPGYTEAFVRRYEIALEQFDWPYLQSHQGRLSRLAGSNSMAARLLGYYQMRLRQYGPALASTQRAIALNPSHGEAYDTLFQIYGRMADQALGQKPPLGHKNAKAYWLKAESALKRGVGLTRNFSEKQALALTLGTYLVENNRAGEADNYANDVLAHDPLNGRAHWLRGKALFYAEKNEAGRTALKTALILLPNDPNTLTTLGQIAEEEGRDAQAMDFYQKAYKADGASYEASQCLRQLMDKLQVSGKRPPAYMKLTPDEHDYLVRMVYFNGQVKNAYLEMMKVMLRLRGENGFTVSHIESMKKNMLLLQTSYAKQLDLYNRVENLQAPRRFETLQYSYLQTHRGLLSLLNESITNNGLFTQQRYEKMVAEAQQRELQMVELQKNGAQAIQRVLSQLSEMEVRGIASEAGWDEKAYFSEFQDMERRLSETEAKGAASKAQAAVTKSNTKNPVVNKLAIPTQSIYNPPETP